jgi:hypothetical protein
LSSASSKQAASLARTSLLPVASAAAAVELDDLGMPAP